jgi:predicted deacylase
MLTEIMPLVDYAVDFHAGGASRFNASNSTRPNNPELKTLADVFNAPFTLYSKKHCRFFRNSSHKLNAKCCFF